VKVVVLAPQAADLQANGARSGEMLEAAREQISELRRSVADAQAAIERLRNENISPAARLKRFVETFAIFFTEQDTLVDPDAAAAGLDELARLLKASGESLRVVGYADESGSPASNRAASRKRADKIVAMLAERGVPREKLALVPRSTLNPIADTGLESARSRRVAFERPFAREFEVR